MPTAWNTPRRRSRRARGTDGHLDRTVTERGALARSKLRTFRRLRIFRNRWSIWTLLRAKAPRSSGCGLALHGLERREAFGVRRIPALSYGRMGFARNAHTTAS